MIKKVLETKAYEKLYNQNKDFFYNEDVIVDLEIINDLRPDWIFKNGIPCVVGFLFKDQIVLFIAEKENDVDFISAVQEYWDVVSELDIYAFNRDFEQDILREYFSIKDAKIKEIKPFNARGWNKDRFFNTLMEEKIIPEFETADPLDNDGSLCPMKWEKYLESENEDHLIDIAGHNVHCLLKESIILKNQQFYKENYNINEKGWLVGLGRKRETIRGKVTEIFEKDKNAIIKVQFKDKQDNDRNIELRSYYRIENNQKIFHEGSNWHRYKRFYGKYPEINDVVKIEPDSKGENYHVLL